MSKISLKSSSSGTATFTIESPATNTDRVLVLPDVAGTVATAESTLAQFNATGSAPVFACRAFVNFNGTGTVAIRASGNVSSITDNGTGDYTVNFTTAMPDANFSLAGWCQGDSGGGGRFLNGIGAHSSSTSRRIETRNASNAPTDMEFVNVAFFR